MSVKNKIYSTIKTGTETWKAHYQKTMHTKHHHDRPVISKRFFIEIVITCGLIFLIGIPRMLDLNSFVTTDETLWLNRSGHFYYALVHQDFAATFQKSHPGVTAMWAGLTGYLEVYPGYPDEQVGLGVLAKRDFTLPLQILVAGRRTMVLLHMFVLGLSFLFASRIFSMKAALVGFLLIAFDPFHIALSRILHLDGLLADLMLLSLLAFLRYLDSHKTGALLISAVAAGLAWLTKSPGLFLIPLMGLLVLSDQLRSDGNWRKVKIWKPILQTAKIMILWGVVSALVFYILWPAMWVDPVGNVVKLFRGAVEYAEAGHASAVFFNGKIYTDGNIPDPLFYPINFLWRTTPITLLGLIAAIGLFVIRWNPLHRNNILWTPGYKSLSEHERSKILQDTNRNVWAITTLILFALGFGALMTLGLKKFDRYIIPSIVPLDLVSGISLVWLIEWTTQKLRKKWMSVVTGSTLLGLVIAQAWLAWTAFPYFFSYYNPLLGGAPRAIDVMQIGWGEGLDQTANYINNKPSPEQIRVIAWYGNGPFSYFSKSKVAPLDVNHQWSTDDWDEFNKSDYAVIYIHEWQRDIPSDVLRYLKNLSPEYSVWLNGLEYAQVYKIK